MYQTKSMLGLSAALLMMSGCGISLPGSVSPNKSTAVTAQKSQITCAPIVLPMVHGALTALDAPPPAYDWQAGWQSCEVLFKSRLYGSMLYATLFAPADLSQVQGRLPVVVVDPGSETGVQANYHWSARELAAQGYLAISVDPQGISYSELVAYPQTIENYMDAVTSSLDFMESAQNPLRDITDVTRMGAAGHSLSAWALSLLQGEDQRIKAIVAWDGLVSEANGDDASAIGPSPVSDVIGSFTAGETPLVTPNRPVLPRVPAMSQTGNTQNTPSRGPGTKKVAYEKWRAMGVPSMQITFLGKSHLDWGQASTAATASDSPKSIELRLFQYYTRAWFDLWLKGDANALKTLTASSVYGQSLDTILSTTFESALFVPSAGIDCPDIAAGTCPQFKP